MSCRIAAKRCFSSCRNRSIYDSMTLTWAESMKNANTKKPTPFRLPLMTDEPVGEKNNPESKSPRILLVDDNQFLLMLLRETLSLFGYQVAGTASTGLEGIQMAKRRLPDLVLMDIEMPGEIDGISAARKIQGEEEIPVVFLTGHVEGELLQRASRVSENGYIVKPFHHTQLRGAIEIALWKTRHSKTLSNADDEPLEKAGEFPTVSEEKESKIKHILSPAEYRVAQLVKKGESTKEIAEELNLSTRTIEWHRMNIRKKLGINKKNSSIFNRLQLI